jgi:hypothetical protein
MKRWISTRDIPALQAHPSNAASVARHAALRSPKGFESMDILGDVRSKFGVAVQYLLFMVRTRVIKENVPDHNEQGFSSAEEFASEWTVRCHVNVTFPHPPPELFLCSPELFIVSAKYSRVFLSFHCLNLNLSIRTMTLKIL